MIHLERLLSSHIQGAVRAGVPLAPFTTYQVGGPAEWLVEPASIEDLRVTWQACREAGVPLTVLGGGSNVLVADEGVRGVVVRTRPGLGSIRLEGDSIVLGAGAWDPDVADRAAAAGIAGFVFLADLPGTIGGAVRMNASNNDGEAAAVVLEVTSLDTEGRLRVWPTSECDFGYRLSRFADSADIIVEARFSTERRASPSALMADNERSRQIRREKFPCERANCGSVFKRPPGDYAGRLIQVANLKGLRLGQAEVSPRHAGFIVNHGGARAADIRALIADVQRRVFEMSGVWLEREVVYLGGPDDPTTQETPRS